MNANSLDGLDARRSPISHRVELRHLSSLCFPILYQILFTYLILIADLVGPGLGKTGFVAFAVFGMVASSLMTLWSLRSRRFNAGHLRLALPMLIALLLPLIQIAMVNWIG